MAYVKQEWNDGTLGNTPITAARLDHMEDGIEAADAKGLPAGGTTGQVLKKNSDGDFDAGWAAESGGGGGGADIWSQIYDAVGKAGGAITEIDTLIRVGDVLAFVWFGSHNANAWKGAVNATYTVPVGKRLSVLEVRGAQPMTETTNRRMRFRNTTLGVDTIAFATFNTALSRINWAGDNAAASKIQEEVPAGSTVRLEMWNGDNVNRRAMGAILIAVEAPA